MAEGKIYLRTGEDLTGMAETPYAAEEVLQLLLAKYPDLLAGDQVTPAEPRRWLLIDREVAVPDVEGGSGRWSLDHLFLDQDGTPTLIEVKRSTNTQIRREVVGQMLDYAANVVAHWPPGELRRLFEGRCEREGLDAESEVRLLLGERLSDEETADQFWQVASNALSARRMRLLFVADVIPRELQRIVEFLNESFASIDVLALEVRQYQQTAAGPQVLVPRIIGRTAAAESAKQLGSGAKKVVRDWTDAEFRAACATGDGGREAAELYDAVVAWSSARGFKRIFGHGKYGPMYVAALGPDGQSARMIDMDAGGNTHIQYVALKAFPPFDSEAGRLELNRRLNEAPDVDIPDYQAVNEAWPTIHIGVLANAQTREPVFQAIDWAAERVAGGR